MYEGFYEKFQNPLFLQILNVKKTGLEIINPLKQEELTNNIYKKFSNIQDEKNAIFTAIAYEIESENLYDDLTNTIEDEQAKDVFFRLWATSSNEYRPALENELNKKKEEKKDDDEKKHINPNNMGFTFDSKSFNEISEVFNKFSTGSATKEDIEKILNNPNISFFTGAVVGALGGILINQILENKNIEK
ncbi:hypothetical protein CBLAS_1361 [Campylobacter blaseri]|nr:hypothetical protein CBLAS_1361 [Campylobacter blaseri]